MIAVRSVYALSVDLSRIDMIEYTPNDTEAAYLAGLITGAECLLSGATTVLDHFAWVPDQELESLEAVVRAYREVGIRAVVAPLVSDQPIENTVAGLPAQPPGSDLSRPVQHIVNCMREAVKRFHRPEESILIGVGPTGVQKCTDQLFRELISLSREYSLPRHSHVLETKQQDIQAREKCGGRSAVQHLHELGWFDSRTTAAHAIHLTEEDARILAQDGATIVHNPVSNARLGSGICPLSMYKRHGVPVALGCDGPASNDGQDMLEAIKLATLLQTLSERDYRNWPSPYETIRMASQGGARGLGLEHELGTLETGKRADLVLYDLTALSILPHTDPVCQLVYGRAGSSLHTVFVGGRRVVQAGCLLTIDLDDLRRRVLARQDFYINERQPKFTLRASIEDRYRKVMNLP